MKKLLVLTFLILFLTSCSLAKPQKSAYQVNLNFNKTSMKLTSSAFNQGTSIPSQYTCDGANINPPLTIADLPANTQSLALIMDDPDAPLGTWVHWLVWNIEPKITAIAENSVPTGASQGTTSFGATGYGGPCPPTGSHHYVFKLYALDTKLDLTPNADKNKLEQAMQNHILDYTELSGLYSRQK